MKPYCYAHERFIPRNWGVAEWCSILAIVVSLISICVSMVILSQ
jgi:hypothetical protein